jgi:hypothetical protein
MTSKPSKMRSVTQRGEPLADAEAHIRQVSWWITSIFVVLVILPLAVLAIYCGDLPARRWAAYGAGVMVSAACCLAGGLLGFIFGVPRALSGDADSKLGENRRRLIPNTNLEEVSDWLTKIIVGATLVQLGALARGFGRLTAFVSSIFGSPSPQNTTMAGGVILYSATFGFFGAYIAARSIITFLFYLSPSDWIPEQGGSRAEQNGDAVEKSPDEPDR